MTDRLIRITTALAVVAVAVVAAVISYQHAFELVRWNRTVDLLLTMDARPVWKGRAGSRQRSSER